MNQVLISIIIAVKNGEKTVKKALDSIFRLEFEQFEVIVVNDGSTDSTGEILKSYGDKISVINTDGEGPSKARNTGIEKSQGKYIVFTDADCIVDKQWLNELEKGFNSADDNMVAGIGGVQLSPSDDSVFGKTIAEYMSAVGFVTDYIKKERENGIYDTEHNPTCNVMYDRKIFSEVGNFLEGLWPGEDVEFDYRVKKRGYRILFNPSAKVYHYRPDNLRNFLKMMYKYGKAQGWLVRKYGFFRKIQFVPLLVIAFVFLMIIYAKYILIALGVLTIFNLLYFLYKKLNIWNAIKFGLYNILTICLWNLGFAEGIIRYNGILKK